MSTLLNHELEEIESIELTDEAKERFIITDKQQLSWVLRKLKVLQQHEEETNDLAQKEIERIKQWQEKELKNISNSKLFFEILITEYALNERIKNTEFKNAKTPYGKIGFKKQQPKWNYDEDKLVKHLEANGFDDLVRVKKEPKKDDIKKQFTVKDGKAIDTNGEIVNGIEVKNQDDKLEIKLS